MGRTAELVTRRYRLPPAYHRDLLLGFLASRAIPGVEAVRRDADAWIYERTLRLPHGVGAMSARVTARQVAVQSWCSSADRDAVDQAVRRIFDLTDASSSAEVQLRQHTEMAPLLGARPGLHIPGAADAAELVVRALVGQQISVPAASTICGRIAADYGAAVDTPFAHLTRTFPGPARLAELDPTTLPMPRSRGRALVEVCARLADGRICLNPDELASSRAGLLDAPGIGPWTADYVGMRALGDRDVLLATDLIVRRAAAALGWPDAPRDLAAYAERFAPLRSYVTFHLWALYAG